MQGWNSSRTDLCQPIQGNPKNQRTRQLTDADIAKRCRSGSNKLTRSLVCFSTGFANCLVPRPTGRNNVDMLANAVQTFAVALIVAGAVGYLLVLLRRSWRTGHGGACSGCSAVKSAGCGVTIAPAPASSPTDTPPQRVFLPIENFTDSARRLREKAASSAEVGHQIADPTASQQERGA